MKTCFKCGAEKPLSEYYESDKRNCRECVKYRSKKNRADKVEYYRAYDRARTNDPTITNKTKVYVGDTFITNEGHSATIIEYNSSKDLVIQFDTGNTLKTSATDLRRGKVSNVLSKRTCGIGFLGEGKYKATEEGTRTEAYKAWKAMFNRCYKPTGNKVETSYSNCYVDEYWHNFQNFADWFYKDPYRQKGWHLDKDIIKQGNRVYSKDLCAFVPSELNCLFTLVQEKESGLPRGVIKVGDVFRSNYGGRTGERFSGNHDSVAEAKQAHTVFRKARVVDVARKYKGLVDKRVIDSILNWDYNKDVT